MPFSTDLLKQLAGRVVDQAEAARAEQHAAEPAADDDDHVCRYGAEFLLDGQSFYADDNDRPRGVYNT